MAEEQNTNKLKMHSPDLTEANIERLAELFPSCVTEARDEDGNLKRAIDFDQLRQEVSDHVVDGPRERYQLNWPGKREALLAANAPIAKTLRPCREESVEFDTTKNLFIEGDNLDALKLLQETYLNKVDFIYIDPPYNTGNDFVYGDDFSSTSEEFLVRSNQKDEAGNRLVVNSERNGRFHSDWLDMMYPRIRLARNLLSELGVIILSIDENEVTNLRKILDEVFGEDNLLFQITLLCNPKGRSQDKYIANCHEYLVGYSRRPLAKGALNVPKSEAEISRSYKLEDDRGRYRELELRNTHREFGKHNRKNLYYPIYVDDGGRVSLDAKPGFEPVFPDWDDGFEGCWTWSIEKARKQLNELVAKKVNGVWKIYRKNYAKGENGEATKQVKSIWIDKRFHTEKGQSAFNELFDTKTKLFQSPKSVETIRELLLMGSNKDSIVMDFFAGSGTTAQAAFEQNAKDGGSRRFILVQLPEEVEPESEAAKAGFSNISDICKERIRRAGRKVGNDSENEEWSQDIGVRVLKVDTSNMKDVYYAPDAVMQDGLFGQIDNIKEDRADEDLLFQILLDWGVDLSVPIESEVISGKTVYFVDENALAACFEADIDEDFVKALAQRKPLRAVFRDSGYGNDSTKINVEQIFKLISPTTEVKTI